MSGATGSWKGPEAPPRGLLRGPGPADTLTPDFCPPDPGESEFLVFGVATFVAVCVGSPKQICTRKPTPLFWNLCICSRPCHTWRSPDCLRTCIF